MGDVVFRRVRGRIIPIRKPKNATPKGESRGASAGKSAAATVLALGVANKAGKIASFFTHEAAKFENSARTLARVADAEIDKATRRIVRRGPRVGDQAVMDFMKESFSPKFRPKLEESLRAAESAQANANRLFKNRLVIRRAGVGAVGGILGYAAIKGAQAIAGRESTKSEQAKLFTAASIVGGALVGAAYYRQFIGLRRGVKMAFRAVKLGK